MTSEKHSLAQPDNAAETAKPAPVTSDPAAEPSSQSEPARQTVAPVEQAPLATDTVMRPDMNTYRLQRLAYAAIFNLWGTYYATDDSPIPCDFAPQVGLQCVRRNGGWSDLENLNMPVVLELWDSEPQPYYGALVSREGGLYTLVVGEDTLTVAPRDLRDSWFGSYVLLWQTPPGYTGNLHLDDRHATVAWLRSRLVDIQQTQIPATTAGEDYFDAELQAAVMRFQQAEGLQADGVAGPMTWVTLNSYLSNNRPKLSP